MPKVSAPVRFSPAATTKPPVVRLPVAWMPRLVFKEPVNELLPVPEEMN